MAHDCIHALKRPLGLVALLIFLGFLVDPLMAAQLQLRHATAGASQTQVLVGDIIDVALWIDSEGSQISGAAIFLTFDEDVFEIIDEDKEPAIAGFQPFARGGFLSNGEVFRNAWLEADDPAASPLGEQIDYSVVRASDSGSGQIATFQLRARAPASAVDIRIDETGLRETRVFLPDGSSDAFRFITPLSVVVRGIGIQGLPEELVLARGQVDTTSFRLASALFDPLYDPSEIQWEVSDSRSFGLEIDPETSLLTIRAPGDTSPWERLTITATNPDGQSTSVEVDVFVNAAPSLTAPEPLVTVEDVPYELNLTGLLNDPDTPASRLSWEIDAPADVSVDITGPPWTATITPEDDWHGTAQIGLTVYDQYGFSDSENVEIVVTSVNDPPVALLSPNVQLTRGKQDSSLNVSALFADAEQAAGEMTLSWLGADQVGIEQQGEAILVTAPASWLGSEEIQLQVTDAEGQTASTLLTVTVVPSLAPAFLSPPSRLGLAAGQQSVIDLADFTSDPDDPLEELTWTAQAEITSELLVQMSASGAALIQAPDGYEGTETIRFIVQDPSGEFTSFDLRVFGAPAGGDPLLIPLPSIDLPAGGVDASIDLDAFVLDLDHDPDQMIWRAIGAPGLDVRVDPTSHVLSISAADSISGAYQIGLEVTDPAGLFTSGLVDVFVTGTNQDSTVVPDPDPPVGPDISLTSLPTLNVTAGTLAQTVNLADYLQGAKVDDLSWELTGGNQTQAYVDATTGHLVVLADADATGPEILSLRGLDAFGNIVVEGLVGVQITVVVPNLELAELSESAILFGDSLLSIDPSQILISSAVDPATLVWSASATVGVDLEIDGDTGALRLGGEILNSVGGQMVTLQARTPDGTVEEGRLLVQVLPIDGSAGNERDGFEVAIIPNPIQPDYLNLYVVDSLMSLPAPRLRSRMVEWFDVGVNPLGHGIWQGSQILAPGVEGTIEFLALALDGQTLLKHSRSIHVGTATPAAGRILSGGGADLHLTSGSFDRETVVAIIPSPISPTVELTPLSVGFELHATQPLQSNAVLEIESADLPGDPLADRSGDLYRWDAASSHWQFLGGEHLEGAVAIQIDRLGRYALLADRVTPVIESATRESTDGSARLRLTDGGSGVDEISFQIDGAPLLARIDYDGEWLTIPPALSGSVTVRVSDHAGNVAQRIVELGGSLPDGFDLAQNFPNPFNPETTIPLTLTRAGVVRVEIIDAVGQRIRVLRDGELSAGPHVLQWHGEDDTGRQVASGIYLYRAITDEGVKTRRMTLLR
ncbi:MAG: T9SS type A sorting domain-containing protein [Gemmatimonadetes bacterium]|jgi:hypothetical protein|nr:T9SS type A sorting domain-containing protein [Gemmatimonadota bacterium]MBT7862003.1 T9SS type A sorting domain-containing protein [Gemmatimonadota bacterium]